MTYSRHAHQRFVLRVSACTSANRPQCPTSPLNRSIRNWASTPLPPPFPPHTPSPHPYWTGKGGGVLKSGLKNASDCLEDEVCCRRLTEPPLDQPQLPADGGRGENCPLYTGQFHRLRFSNRTYVSQQSYPHLRQPASFRDLELQGGHVTVPDN